MIEHKILDLNKHLFIIKPNPAMSWGLIKKIYFCFALFVLIIAIVLSTVNLYLAIPFYGIEVIFLGYALYITALKSTYFEEVFLDQNNIKVTFVNGKRKKNYNFVRQWSEFKYNIATKTQPSEIFIAKSGDKVFVARNVNEDDRKKLFNLIKTL
jgi:uncharacterized membrane protein|tara:strand:- start:61 stop:522 length:462 start_codon:yes stop_codon:yes gene_type:complete